MVSWQKEYETKRLKKEDYYFHCPNFKTGSGKAVPNGQVGTGAWQDSIPKVPKPESHNWPP